MIQLTFSLRLENYNPKSLSEIAADKTTKLTTHLSENNSVNNTASTPKIFRKESLKSDVSSDFDLDGSIDNRKNFGRRNKIMSLSLLSF